MSTHSGPHFPHFLFTVALPIELWGLPAPRCHRAGPGSRPQQAGQSKGLQGQPRPQSSSACDRRMAHRVEGTGVEEGAWLSGQSKGHPEGQGQRP